MVNMSNGIVLVDTNTSAAGFFEDQVVNLCAHDELKQLARKEELLCILVTSNLYDPGRFTEIEVLVP